MPVEIHPISLGFVHVFLLKGQKNVLIDAGAPGQKDRLTILDGPTKSGTVDILRKEHGSIGWIRFGRIYKKQVQSSANP